MANKIYNIGRDQTNLLSNDNLVVYSDISMKSKFNSAATSTKFFSEPRLTSYLVDLELEDYKININGTTTLVDANDNDIKWDNVSNYNNINLGNSSTIKILPNNKYIEDHNSYIINTSMSKYKVDKNVNVKAVQNSLHNIFTWLPGERILNPEFGNTLYKYLYSGITNYNTEQIIAEIQHCISEYEPRVSINQIVNVSTIDDTENNTIHLEIIYSIPTLNEQQYSYMYTYTKNSE